MEQFFDYLKNQLNIDLIIVMLVIMSGFFQEKYMGGKRLAKSDRLDASLKTLILSAGISVAYILLFYNFTRKVNVKNNVPVDPIPWAKYLISYFAATSLYDLIISPVRKFLIRKFGADADTDQTVRNNLHQ